MKKTTIFSIVMLGLLIAGPVFARVDYTEASINSSGGTKSDHQILFNLLDLQKQVDQLNQKNQELERKISQTSVQTVVPQIVQVSPNVAAQTQRIDNLEQRVGVLEGLMNSLKISINKVLELLTRLLAKI